MPVEESASEIFRRFSERLGAISQTFAGITEGAEMPDSRERYLERINREVTEARLATQRRQQQERINADMSAPEPPVGIGGNPYTWATGNWTITTAPQWTTLGAIVDNGPGTYNDEMVMPQMSSRRTILGHVNTTPAPVELPEDTTMWWGGCGLARCWCRTGAYRDSRFTIPVPGTQETRGYVITTRTRQGRGRVRTWQANSERRARAYASIAYPEEKVVNVRRAKKNEVYAPAQCDISRDVTYSISATKVY